MAGQKSFNTVPLFDLEGRRKLVNEYDVPSYLELGWTREQDAKPASDATTLDSFKVADLRAYAEEHEIEVSGNKPEVVATLASKGVTPDDVAEWMEE